MTVRYTDDSTYMAAMQRNAAAMYPADVAEFRVTWSTATVDWIRTTSQLLSDNEISTLSSALRAALLSGKADLTEIWQLAALQAGVL